MEEKRARGDTKDKSDDKGGNFYNRIFICKEREGSIKFSICDVDRVNGKNRNE